jgi:hypothetical protein
LEPEWGFGHIKKKRDYERDLRKETRTTQQRRAPIPGQGPVPARVVGPGVCSGVAATVSGGGGEVAVGGALVMVTDNAGLEAETCSTGL